MFCENCGSRIEEGFQFCIQCGQTVVTEEPKPATPVRKSAPRPRQRTTFIEKVWDNEKTKKSLLIAGCAIAAAAVIIFLCCFAFAGAPEAF